FFVARAFFVPPLETVSCTQHFIGQPVVSLLVSPSFSRLSPRLASGGCALTARDHPSQVRPPNTPKAQHASRRKQTIRRSRSCFRASRGKRHRSRSSRSSAARFHKLSS